MILQWCAATRRRLACKAVTSHRTPQTQTNGLNDDKDPTEFIFFRVGYNTGTRRMNSPLQISTCRI